MRLTCPKCGQPFDYDYIPGASTSAIRLGGSRYMACPLCGKFSTFPIRAARKAGAGAMAGLNVPAYSDSRLLARRLPWLFLPIAAGLLALVWYATYPVLVLWIEIASVVVFVLLAGVLLIAGRPPLRVPRPPPP